MVIIEAFAVELKETVLDTVYAPAIEIALLEGAHLSAVQSTSLALLIFGEHRSVRQFESQIEPVEVRRRIEHSGVQVRTDLFVNLKLHHQILAFREDERLVRVKVHRLQLFTVDVQVLVQEERVLGELQTSFHIDLVQVDDQRLVIAFGGERGEIDQPSAVDRQRKRVWEERTRYKAMSAVLDQTITVLVMIS